MFAGIAVGHRTTPHFLGDAVAIHVRASHMGVRRHLIFIKFHRIRLGPAKNTFLLIYRQFVEGLQVVNPFRVSSQLPPAPG